MRLDSPTTPVADLAPQLPGGWTLPEDMPPRRAAAARRTLPTQRRPSALESPRTTMHVERPFADSAPRPCLGALKTDRGSWSVPPPRPSKLPTVVPGERVLPIPALVPSATGPTQRAGGASEPGRPARGASEPAPWAGGAPRPAQRAAQARGRTRRWRRPLLAGTLAVATAFASGAPTLGDDTRSLTLFVDGQPRTITSAAGTVGEALASVGIVIGEHDVVAPAATAAVRDGSAVSIRRGRLVTATVDGRRRQMWTTATTVQQAMSELGLNADDFLLSAARGRRIGAEGISVNGQALHPVTLADGRGSVRSLRVPGTTVADVLTGQGIVLAGRDTVQPAPDTPARDGLRILVTRIRVTDRSVAENIAQPAPVMIDDPTLGRGRTAVAEPGRDGQRVITVERTSVDGRVSEKVIAAAVVRTPLAKVTRVGTKESGDREAWSVPWDKMAFCESTDRWSVNTGNGTYGGLQFKTPTWLEYGGGQFAPRADLATEEQQIIVAERLYAKEGLAPWHCARLLGWGFGKYQG